MFIQHFGDQRLADLVTHLLVKTIFYLSEADMSDQRRGAVSLYSSSMRQGRGKCPHHETSKNKPILVVLGFFPIFSSSHIEWKIIRIIMQKMCSLPSSWCQTLALRRNQWRSSSKQKSTDAVFLAREESLQPMKCIWTVRKWFGDVNLLYIYMHMYK